MISPNNQANLQGANAPQGRLSNAFFIRGGRDAAVNYPVAAGYEAFLVDEENKMFFIKKNSPQGGFILREFTYEEVTPQQNTAFGTPDGFDPSKYATKEDLNMILEELKKLQGGRSRGHQYNNRSNRRTRNGKSYDE